MKLFPPGRFEHFPILAYLSLSLLRCKPRSKSVSKPFDLLLLGTFPFLLGDVTERPQQTTPRAGIERLDGVLDDSAVGTVSDSFAKLR